MHIYILLLLFTMLICLCLLRNNNETKKVKQKEKVLCFIIVFLVLGIFSAIRDGIGIDYDSYVRHINTIQLGNEVYMEKGFQKFVLFISIFNKNPRVILAVLSLLTCYFYVKGIFEQSKNITMSIYIFLTWGYYFLSFNTVRNYFALSIIFYAMKFLDNKKDKLKFIILVFIASCFHKSALVCLIFTFLDKKIKSKHIYILMALGLFALVFKSEIRNIVFLFYSGYENSLYDVNRVSYLNIIKATVVVGLGVLYKNKYSEDKINNLYLNLNIISLFIYVFLYWLPEISRIGFYFNACSILFISNLNFKVKRNEEKIIFSLGIYGASFILFLLLMKGFYSPTTKLLPYVYNWNF